MKQRKRHSRWSASLIDGWLRSLVAMYRSGRWYEKDLDWGSARSILEDDVESVDDTGNVTENGQKDVDPEVTVGRTIRGEPQSIRSGQKRMV